MYRKKRSPIRFLIWIIVLCLLIGAAYFGFSAYQGAPMDSNGKVVAFVVKPGDTVSGIADRLVKQRIIRNAQSFKDAFNILDDSKVLPGDYKLSPSMNAKEVAEALTKGPVDLWVTIIEGWRDEQIARKLNQDLGIGEEGFLENAKQGYMFPDTYLFNPKATGADIASIMKSNFDKKYDANLQAKIKAKGLTPEQGVILASMIEREARSDEVRTKVAGILLKRLKMGMKLDIDATVQYASDTQQLNQGKKDIVFWQPITQDHYQDIKSPYNTYLNPGLPPGPISNPSLSSLNAVANADPNTPYLYYYHDSQGNSYYAKTLDEHNANVANH